MKQIENLNQVNQGQYVLLTQNQIHLIKVDLDGHNLGTIWEALKIMRPDIIIVTRVF